MATQLKSITFDKPLWIEDTGVWRVITDDDTVSVWLKEDIASDSPVANNLVAKKVFHGGKTFAYDRVLGGANPTQDVRPEDIHSPTTAFMNPGCTEVVELTGPTFESGGDPGADDLKYIRIRTAAGATNFFEWQYVEDDYADDAEVIAAVVAALVDAGFPTTNTGSGPNTFDVTVPLNWLVVLEA